jgi:hypothetical protein
VTRTRTWTAVVLAAAAVAVSAALHHRTVRRQLARERAVARLTDNLHQRDLTALTTRITAAARQQAVLDDADRILTRAIAAHTPKKGG